MQPQIQLRLCGKWRLKVKLLTIHFLLKRFSLPRFLDKKICRGLKGFAEEPLVPFNSMERNEQFWDRWVPGTALCRLEHCLVTFARQQRPLEANRKKPYFCSTLACLDFYEGVMRGKKTEFIVDWGTQNDNGFTQLTEKVLSFMTLCAWVYLLSPHKPAWDMLSTKCYDVGLT